MIGSSFFIICWIFSLHVFSVYKNQLLVLCNREERNPSMDFTQTLPKAALFVNAKCDKRLLLLPLLDFALIQFSSGSSVSGNMNEKKSSQKLLA